MSGIVSEVTKIWRKVLTEVASLLIEDRPVTEIDSIPRRLIEEGLTNYRCCKHKEKAILRERIKLALGLEPSSIGEDERLADIAGDLLKGVTLEKNTPYITIIEEACDHCSIDKIVVTNACRNCVAHHCINSCPRNAIKIMGNRAFIDKNKCVECGFCTRACPYGAILEIERPCSRACAVNAIIPGERTSAQIDYDKCVECGACITACPFGAISYSSEIVKVIKLLREKKTKVAALIAPSFMGQFGTTVDWNTLVSGLKRLGFNAVFPVAAGADKVIKEEGEELLTRLKEGQKLMFNSCCPSFKNLLQRYFPASYEHLSSTRSPMLQTAGLVKDLGDFKCVFIGPCVSKKGEAIREGKGLIDAVLTFEELTAILVAADINLAEIEAEVEVEITFSNINQPTLDAVNFCQAGGVGRAIKKAVQGRKELRIEAVAGISDCITLLRKIAAGKVEADFIEGMGCQEGCIGGPGTLVNPRVARRVLEGGISNVRRAEKEGEGNTCECY